MEPEPELTGGLDQRLKDPRRAVRKDVVVVRRKRAPGQKQT
jgi:hypothetical protein